MLIHRHQIRVRYGETDQMGYLYYGHYPAYYEVARAEMIRSLGYTYRKLEEELNIMMPVMSLNMRYVRPAKYDDLLTIETTLRRAPDKFMTFHHEVFNEKGKLLNGGSVKLGFIEADSRKSCKAPKLLVDIVNKGIENQ